MTVFRSSGLTGPVGAAFAAARAMGLPQPEMVSAASLAAQTSAGLNAWAYAGTDEHPFHIGFASRNGVVAATLAAHGVTAAPTALDGRGGLLSGYGAQEKCRLLTDELGARFDTLGVAHKPAPACYFAQSPAQLAARMARETIATADIHSVEIFVSDAAAQFPGCDNRGPMRSRQDAAMSIQFCVASVLLNGAIDERSWGEFNDATVNELAARSRLGVDAGLSRTSPHAQGARIVVKLSSGQTIESRQDDVRSMTHDEVVGRFFAAGDPFVGSARLSEFVGIVERLEKVASVRDAMRPLATA